MARFWDVELTRIWRIFITPPKSLKKLKDWDKERMGEAICAHNDANIIPIRDGELKACFAEFATSRIIFVFDTCLAGDMK